MFGFFKRNKKEAKFRCEGAEYVELQGGIRVREQDHEGCYSTDGKELLPPIYDRIKIDGDEVTAIKGTIVKTFSLKELMEKSDK